MSLRDQLPRIIACDPRFSIDAYAFVLEALDHARVQKLNALRTRPRPTGRVGESPPGDIRQVPIPAASASPAT